MCSGLIFIFILLIETYGQRLKEYNFRVPSFGWTMKIIKNCCGIIYAAVFCFKFIMSEDPSP